MSEDPFAGVRFALERVALKCVVVPHTPDPLPAPEPAMIDPPAHVGWPLDEIQESTVDTLPLEATPTINNNDDAITSIESTVESVRIHVTDENEWDEEMTCRLHAMCRHPDYDYRVIETTCLVPNMITPSFDLKIDPKSGWEINTEWNGQRLVEERDNGIKYKKSTRAPKGEGILITPEIYTETNMSERYDDIIGVKSEGMMAISTLYNLRVPLRRLKKDPCKPTPKLRVGK